MGRTPEVPAASSGRLFVFAFLRGCFDAQMKVAFNPVTRNYEVRAKAADAQSTKNARVHCGVGPRAVRRTAPSRGAVQELAVKAGLRAALDPIGLAVAPTVAASLVLTPPKMQSTRHWNDAQTRALAARLDAALTRQQNAVPLVVDTLARPGEAVTRLVAGGAADVLAAAVSHRHAVALSETTTSPRNERDRIIVNERQGVRIVRDAKTRGVDDDHGPWSPPGAVRHPPSLPRGPSIWGETDTDYEAIRTLASREPGMPRGGPPVSRREPPKVTASSPSLHGARGCGSTRAGAFRDPSAVWPSEFVAEYSRTTGRKLSGVANDLSTKTLLSRPPLGGAPTRSRFNDDDCDDAPIDEEDAELDRLLDEAVSGGAPSVTSAGRTRSSVAFGKIEPSQPLTPGRSHVATPSTRPRT